MSAPDTKATRCLLPDHSYLLHSTQAATVLCGSPEHEPLISRAEMVAYLREQARQWGIAERHSGTGESVEGAMNQMADALEGK